MVLITASTFHSWITKHTVTVHETGTTVFLLLLLQCARSRLQSAVLVPTCSGVAFLAPYRSEFKLSFRSWRGLGGH
ncbi:hypothetical protein DFH29DRAFT_960062 [Suillus ampliporus]|nr:hypothetical protein DFH29DRAFT_960062 [Suillus ampliporus]